MRSPPPACSRKSGPICPGLAQVLNDGTVGNGVAINTLKAVIDAATNPNSSSTSTNVQSSGDVAANTASKTSGLIYLEAGKTYTFSAQRRRPACG